MPADSVEEEAPVLEEAALQEEAQDEKAIPEEDRRAVLRCIAAFHMWPLGRMMTKSLGKPGPATTKQAQLLA